MKKWNGYEDTQAYSDNEKLPTGGYVLKIQNVRLDEGKNGNSDVLVIAFDIAEGEQAGFYSVIMMHRRKKIRNGKVSTGCIVQRMMVPIRITGRSVGLRRSWRHLKLLTRDIIGTGTRQP